MITNVVLEVTENTFDNRQMNHAVVRYYHLFALGFALVLNVMMATAQSKSPAKGTPMSFQITTTSFSPGGNIPKRFTCDAEDVSPELSWTDPPTSTAAFALIVDDPDAPVGIWNHWLAWNIPPNVKQLASGFSKQADQSDGTRQGRNDFGKIGYNGPCPPRGKPHHYFFKLLALDSNLSLTSGAGRRELESALKGHVLATAEVMGMYGR